MAQGKEYFGVFLLTTLSFPQLRSPGGTARFLKKTYDLSPSVIPQPSISHTSWSIATLQIPFTVIDLLSTETPAGSREPKGARIIF